MPTFRREALRRCVVVTWLSHLSAAATADARRRRILAEEQAGQEAEPGERHNERGVGSMTVALALGGRVTPTGTSVASTAPLPGGCCRGRAPWWEG